MLKPFHAPRAAIPSRILVWVFTLAAPAGALVHSTFALADPPTQAVNVSIPAGDLDTALQALARQTGTDIVFRPELVKGLKTSGVSGQLTAREAVDALLKGTTLSVRSDGGSMIIVAGTPSPLGAEPLSFSIPAGELGAALKAFSDQAHLTVKYSDRLVRGKTTQGLSGSYAPARALEMVLTGTGLTATAANASTYVLKALPKVKSAAVGPSAEGSEHVLVPGTRLNPYEPGGNVDLPRTINDAQPYYIFDSATIEQSGALNVEDFLKNYLTMNTVAQTNGQVYGTNNGPPLGTTSSINLRGLGTGETLILVDGRRRPGVSFQGNSEQPDVNGIPLAAIDRIEVLPSGASAIYGGSAMGGVINIILKKNYSGGEVKYSYGNVTSGSSPIQNVDATYGFSTGGTQVMFTGHYSDAQPLSLDDRVGMVESGIDTIIRNVPCTSTSGILCGPLALGTSLVFPGGTTPNILSGIPMFGPTGLTFANLTLLNGTSLHAPNTYIPLGTSTSTPTSTLDAGLLKNAGQSNLNLAPGYGMFGLQQPLGYSPQVESAMATVTHQFTPSIDAFAEASVEHNAGSMVYNPFADSAQLVQAGSAQYVLGQGNRPNPANPFQQSVNVTLPSTLSVPETTTSQTEAMTIGLTARLPHQWNGEADYTWSKNSFSYSYYQVDQDPLAGIAGLDETGITGVLNNGVLNPFVDTSAHPLSLAPYLQPNSYGSSSALNDVALRASGPLFQLPWGKPQLTLGMEYRKENEPFDTQTSVSAVNTPEVNEADTYFFAQSQSTVAMYGEAEIPLVTDSNAIPGVRALSLQLADRAERYSVDAGTTSEYYLPSSINTSGVVQPPYHCYIPALDSACQVPVSNSTATYTSNNATAGLKYKPVDDLTLRASYATAFLPPSYSQLLPDPMVIQSGDYITDPKTGLMYSVNTIGGGNASLKPESDKSWDLGVIYEPQEESLRNLRVNMEFYQITQINAIVSLAGLGNTILTDPALAGRVTRSPTTGLITLINESDFNATRYKTEGWDTALDYRKPTSAGVFSLHAGATLIEHELRQLTPNTPLLDYVGYPEGGGEAKAKANGSLRWERGQWMLGWITTYFGPYQVGNPSFYPSAEAAQVQRQGASEIPSQVYHDLIASYSTGKSSIAHGLASNITVQMGIRDIFNTLPPFEAYYAPFYYSPYGNIRLREYWISVEKAF